MHIEHLLRKGEIPAYVSEIARLGICPVMLPADSYETAEGRVLRYDTDGLTGLKTLLSRPQSGTFPRLLSMLRKVAEGSALLEDYLIKPEYVSMSLEDIYFGADGKVKFLVELCKPNLCEKICSLCEEIYISFPYTNADLVLKKLAGMNAERLVGINELLRMLSAWELEIRK